MAEQPEEKGIGEAYRDRIVDQIVAEDEGTPQTPVEPPTYPITRRDYFQTAGTDVNVYPGAPKAFDILALLGRESITGNIICDAITSSATGGLTVRINRGNNFNLNIGDQCNWPPIQWVVFPVRYIELWAQDSSGAQYRVMCI